MDNKKFGITRDGFRRKTYSEILESLQARAREAYGSNVNLTNSSFLGMHLQNEAWEIAELWEEAEDVYYSAFVDTSEHHSLDGVGKYITISRKPAQRSKGVITIKGQEGTRIPRGFRVGNNNLDIIFETTERVVVGESEEVEAPIISVGSGLNQNVSAYSLVKMVNPISGISEVYNKELTEGGSDIEPDKEFRERYYRSPSRGGGATRPAVEAALLDMENVADAFVEENESMEYMGDVPPKALAPYVFGGEDEEIAKVIMKSKAGGIRSFGNIEVQVTDSKGRDHVIGFTRPEVVDIYVRLNIEKGQSYPGDDVITRAVINYIGGEGEDGIPYRGLRLREDVVHSRVVGSIMCLGGIKDIEVELSTDNENYIQSNIEIDGISIARTRYDKVVINYV